jgi:membrane dipeptidase
MKTRSMTRLVLGFGLLALAPTPAPAADDPLLERARALLKRVPLIDGHNDYPWETLEKAGGDLAKFDLKKPQPQLDTDFARLRAGGVGGQFWSVYTPSTQQGPEATRRTLEVVDFVRRMVERWPDELQLATSAAEVEAAFARGRIASLLGVEGGHAIDSSLATLRMLAALGVRYMTLTHSDSVPWADSATGTQREGLTRFGEEVVREMNRSGVLVDLSHVSADTMRDALRVSEAPVIFSHSSARAICDHPRNAPDDVLALLKPNGGVIMVTFVPSFVSPEGAQEAKRVRAERDRLKSLHPDDPKKVSAGLEAWFAQNPGPPATLSQVADHIDHVRKVAGIDHIGLGSDFDGVSRLPVGLEDVSKFPALLAELLRRGYSEADVEKIAGRNILRVLAESERVARRLQAQRPPSLATLEQLDGREAAPAGR